MSDYQKVANMLTVQDELNKQFIGEDWCDKSEGVKFNWARYQRVEAVELMVHYNTFKHWKKPEPDIEQARIELIDIWHFILAELLYMECDMDYIESCVDAFGEGMQYAADQPVIVNDVVDAFVSSTYGEIEDSMYNFGMLHTLLDVDLDWATGYYLGKVALNKLRIEKGQYEGTYVKHWGKEQLEDNVYLENILQGCLAAGTTITVKHVLDQLRETYDKEVTQDAH